MSRIDLAYREPASLIMSGVESDAYWNIAKNAGITNVLISYHYIQRKGVKWLRERMTENPEMKLMIDSGAYTFHSAPEEYEDKPLEFWENYASKYTGFLHNNADIIFSCVNLDIANFVGQSKLDEWDAKYFAPLEEKGVLVCHVWHEFDGRAMWETMCKKHRYVGFSLATGNTAETEMSRMFNIARRYNTLVHGFAVTRVDTMSRFPFYTGDSTTWLVGTQYGELNWFDGRTMKRLKKHVWKRQYKMKYIKLGANWDLADKENPYELIRINLLVFLEAEKYIRNRVRAKQYWGGKNIPIKKEVKKMSIFKRPQAESTAEAAPAAAPKKIKTVLKKGADAREDLKEQGKSKFDEFLESQQPAAKPKAKPKLRIKIPARPDVTKLPEKEWFDGEMDDFLMYAETCNINPDLSQEDIVDILYMMRMFLLPDEEALSALTDDQMLELVASLLQVTEEDRESAEDALRAFYAANLSGARTDFLEAAEDEQEAPQRAKERDTYLSDDDDEVEVVDVNAADLQGIAMLPPPLDASMEEVDAYDAELRTMGIVAVRDDKGRFLKGQKVVRKPKQLYSKHFPKLACNTCYKAGDCPEFKPDSVCAYENIFKKFDTRDAHDVMDAMHGMVNINLGRMQRLAMFEIMDGGMTDPALTGMIDQNMKLLMTMKQMSEATRSIMAQQTTRINADGSRETVTQVNNPGGGLLERIFMNSNVGATDIHEDVDDASRKIIDVTPEV